MSFIRYKVIGKSRYAYDITSYWDAELKKVRQKTKYLGAVDQNNKRIQKEKSIRSERLILDFGDGYLLHQFIETTPLYEPLKKVLKEHFQQTLSLVFYRLCKTSALSHAQSWIEGNILSCLYKTKALTSPENSRLLTILGNEHVQRSFFRSYLARLKKPLEGVIIDSTALPNDIHSGFNAWGYSDGCIEKQMRFLCVIDQQTAMPLFFRCLAGNIIDVSTLRITLKELEKLGVNHSFLLVDAGYFSEENIQELFKNNIQFLTRLPARRKLYQFLIDEEYHHLERKEFAVRSGKRGLFVKEKEIFLYGNKAYAYLILDPERKGKVLSQWIAESVGESTHDLDFTGAGTFILVSSFKIDKKKVVSHYYLRQRVEQVFGFLKDDLQVLPLRRHNEETIRGYLFLIFLTLILFLALKNTLEGKYTVEQALLIARNLKCKVFHDEIIPQELNKQQKELFEQIKTMVPKSVAI